MTKSKNKKRSKKGLGDDPLSWINENSGKSGQPAARQNMQANTEVLRSNQTAIKTSTPPAAENIQGVKNNELPGVPSSRNTEAALRQSAILIVLDQVLTIADAHKLKEQLLPYLKATGEIKIDGSKVEMIDTSTMQVLVAFLNTLKQRGVTGKWVGASRPLLNTSRLLGLTKQLGL